MGQNALNRSLRIAYPLTLAATLGLLGACQKSDSSSSDSGSTTGTTTSTVSTTSYTVGVTVTGLSGTVVLQNNGGDNLSETSDGTYTFATSVASGSAYAVTVLTQPTDQTCSVTSGSGTMGNANVTDVAVACTSSSTNFYTTATDGGCAALDNTAPTATKTDTGCTLLTRDVSSCKATREAAGLSGAWLKFSCNVGLAVVTIGGKQYVQVTSKSEPDYKSKYWSNTDACYQAYTTAFPDPNTIAEKSIVMNVPMTPDTTNTAQSLGTVGIALNGVAIYDNQAAPGDDIFEEAGSFDECGGHPQGQGVYHYHGDPYAISNNDSNLIGVMRDGYFIYGRKNVDGTEPTNLDAQGGQTSTTVDSDVAVYHYNLNPQTDTGSGTYAGQTQYFLTTGTYHGSPGTCTGC